jgi:hypothetical protein
MALGLQDQPECEMVVVDRTDVRWRGSFNSNLSFNRGNEDCYSYLARPIVCVRGSILMVQ